LDLLLRQCQSSYSETTAYSYDNADRLTGQTNGNSSTVAYAYDDDDRPTDVWHKTGGGVTLARCQYGYDTAGNVTSRIDNGTVTTTFGYDGADQLTSEQRGGGGYSISYAYDHNGNRTGKTLNGVTETYTYDAHDKLQTAGAKSYTYDNNGNCTAVTVGGQTTSLTYDYENRVTGITYPNTSTNSFQYNALNLRTRKVDSGGTVNYMADGTAPASPVLKDSGAVYTPGLSERRGGTSKFLHGDAIGSTRAVSDGTQATTDTILYDGFGLVMNRTGTSALPFGYVGGKQYQTDSDSGLMLLGNRYYDCATGRFISRDPIHAGSNWYAYCQNNPVTRTDPRGLEWKWVTQLRLFFWMLFARTPRPPNIPPPTPNPIPGPAPPTPQPPIFRPINTNLPGRIGPVAEPLPPSGNIPGWLRSRYYLRHEPHTLNPLVGFEAPEVEVRWAG
jgi:RHS repeat-associated protein